MAQSEARFFAQKRAWLGALGLCLALPTLGHGFLTDDHRFRALVASSSVRGTAGWFPDLFAFASGTVSANLASIASGGLPWWTAPDFRMHLWRPITCALFVAQYRVFAGHARGYHAVSLVLLGLLLWAVQRLYRTVLPGNSGAWALAVFALHGARPDAYGWIAAQHVLVSGIFVAHALIAQVTPGARASRPWLVPGRLALGLLSSESAVCGVLFVLAHEASRALAPPHAENPKHGRAVARRFFVSNWRTLLLTIAYFAVYHELGFGTRSGGFYRDPIRSPLAFLHVAPRRLFVLLADAFGAWPAELGFAAGSATAAGIGIFTTALLGLFFLSQRASLSNTERRALRWLVPGAALSLFVAAAGVPGGRVLMLPSVGLAALLGVVLHVAWERKQWVALLAVGLPQLVIAPLSALTTQRRTEQRARITERVGRALVADIGSSRAAFLFASDPFVFGSAYSVLFDESPDFDACLSVASGARGRQRIRRTGPQALLLETLEEPLLAGSFDTFVRDELHPLAVGARIHQCGADYVVKRLDAGRPSAIELDLTSAPSEPSFFFWNGEKLARFALPDVGQSLILPWSTGPSGIY